MAGMALDDFLMPFAAMALTHQLMDAKKRKNLGIVGQPSPNILQNIGLPTDTRHRKPQNVLERMGLPTSTKTTVDPRNQGISYNPLLMR